MPDVPTNEEREEGMNRWAEKNGLHQSHATGDPVAWLAGKRADYRMYRWLDHGTRWLRDGKPYCLVGQPYQLLEDDIRELAELIEKGFDVQIGTRPAWHYPGGVLHIEVRRDRESAGR